MSKENPTRVWVDVNPDTEDHYIFYNRKTNGSDMVVIPKNTDWQKFTLTETPDSYIITVTKLEDKE